MATTAKGANVLLCDSRMFFVRAYPRESQEMSDVFAKAFAFFGGACMRGIYDNISSGGRGLGRQGAQVQPTLLQMCNHFLIEPTACTPAPGWEKGQVENQVELVRERISAKRR